MLAEDPYLALNRHQNLLAQAVSELPPNGAAAAVGSPTPDAMERVFTAVKSVAEALSAVAALQKNAPRISIPEIKIPAMPTPPKEWDVEITSRDDDGRAKTFKFRAV